MSPKKSKLYDHSVRNFEVDLSQYFISGNQSKWRAIDCSFYCSSIESKPFFFLSKWTQIQENGRRHTKHVQHNAKMRL